MSISMNKVSGFMPSAMTGMGAIKAATVEGRQKLPESGNNSPRTDQPVASRGTDRAAAANFDDYFKGLPRNLQFEVDDQSGVSIITVSDRETGEIIRQFPSDEILASARYIAEQAPAGKVGILLNSEG